MQEKLKIGFIGTGNHVSRSHAACLEKMDGVVLSAAFDPNKTHLQEFAERFGIEDIFTSEEAFFEAKPVDALVIGSPDRFHFAQLRESLRTGIHTLIEKPMAENMEDARTLENLLAEAKEKALVLTSCHPRRFDRPYVWLKENLEKCKEKLGDIISIRLDFSYHEPTKMNLHKGLLMDHVNHEIDLINFLLGHSKVVLHKFFDSQTRYNCAGQRADGVTLMFSGTRMLKGGIYSEFVEVRFARGLLRLNTHTGKVELSDQDASPSKVEIMECGTTDYERRNMGVNQNFVDMITKNSQNYLTPQDLIINTRSGIFLTETGIFKG